MGGRRIAAPLVLIAVCLGGTPCDGATVSFESIPIGTVFGPVAGNLRGETVLIQEGIAMSIDELILDAASAFNRATIGGEYVDFFETTPLELNNISAVFDFTAVAFTVDGVSLEVQDFGGVANLSVNGGTLIDLLALDGTPQIIAPGVSAVLVDDLLTFEGAIDRLQIGGQEMAIDNVRAVPEPATAILGFLALPWITRRRRRSA